VYTYTYVYTALQRVTPVHVRALYTYSTCTSPTKIVPGISISGNRINLLPEVARTRTVGLQYMYTYSTCTRSPTCTTLYNYSTPSHVCPDGIELSFVYCRATCTCTVTVRVRVILVRSPTCTSKCTLRCTRTPAEIGLRKFHKASRVHV
jgi:hypothetical protein